MSTLKLERDEKTGQPITPYQVAVSKRADELKRANGATTLGHYADAMLEIKKQRPDLFAQDERVMAAYRFGSEYFGALEPGEESAIETFSAGNLAIMKAEAMADANPYAGLAQPPNLAGAPLYTRLAPPAIEAKNQLDPGANYEGRDIHPPKDYDPHGLLESVVLTDVAQRSIAFAFWHGQFKTAADVVRYMLGDHIGRGQVAQAGGTNATAVSGARMVSK